VNFLILSAREIPPEILYLSRPAVGCGATERGRFAGGVLGTPSAPESLLVLVGAMLICLSIIGVLLLRLKSLHNGGARMNVFYLDHKNGAVPF